MAHNLLLKINRIWRITLNFKSIEFTFRLTKTNVCIMCVHCTAENKERVIFCLNSLVLWTKGANKIEKKPRAWSSRLVLERNIRSSLYERAIFFLAVVHSRAKSRGKWLEEELEISLCAESVLSQPYSALHDTDLNNYIISSQNQGPLLQSLPFPYL